MASMMLKSFKTMRIFNRRLSFSYTKLHYFNSRRLNRLFECSKSEIACYTTAAHKHVSKDESMVRNGSVNSSKDQSRSPVDDVLHIINLVVRRTGRIQMKEINKAFSMITSKEMTSSTHGLYLLRCCKYCYSEPPSKRIELVNQIWNKYQELGTKFDVRHYNALLDVHISNGLAFNPVEILNSMEDDGIEPDKVTYLLVMKKYCEDGDINGASEILEHMKEKGLPANEDVFNNLIQGHLKNNDFSGAKEMIEVMRSSNLEPTADTYTILACGYATSGNKDEMLAYLKEINPESYVQNYLKVIDALASSSNHQLIDEVLSLIKEKNKYQPEFLNCAIELIHKGLADIAYKLIISSYTPQYEQITHIFIKQLIKTGKPVEDVTNYCTKIFEEGYSSSIFQVAAKAAAEYRKLDYIVPVFKIMLEKGLFIRPSNFWALFNCFKEEKSLESIFTILKHMYDLGVPADFTTYYDIIFPILGEPHPNIVFNVEKSGQSKNTAADALFLYYCDLGKIDYLHHLIEIAPVHVSEKVNAEKFVSLYDTLSRDTNHKYFKVLKYMFSQENYTLDYLDIRGKLLAEIISKKPRLLEVLLEKFDDLKFSDQTLHSANQILSAMKPFKRGYLLALGRLRNMSIEREFMFKDDLTLEEEKEQIKHMQAQNTPCRPFLLRRINYHIKEKNATRVCELLSLFDELKLPYSPILLSNLTAFYCMGSDVEKALETFNKLKTEFPSFKIDLSKAIEYIALLVKYQKLDESVEALKSITEPYSYTNRDIVVNKIRNLSLAVANTNNPEFAKTMQNLLIPLSKEFKTKKAFLDSVLHLHLQRQDFNAAFEEFQSCVKNYHTPTGLNLFLRKCISLNEKVYLQKVIDLTISCVGESYTLLELCVAFIETRDYDKASAVIESLGERIDPKDMETLCMRLNSQNKLRELEYFLRITRHLNHDNREDLYILAIKAYAAKNDFDKTLELFNQLKSEVGTPSSKTIQFIQQFFVKHNKPVPLNIVSKEPPEANPLTVEATKAFMEHLETGNAEAALKELSDMKKGYIRTLTIKTLTNLLDLCLQENYVSDLASNVNLMSYIIDNAKEVMKPVIEKYSAAGDIEKLITISRFFPDFSLMNFGFNSYFCRAFLLNGKHEELLSHLEQRVDKKNKLFSTAAFEEFLKYPEYEDKVFDLAVKYYNSKFTLPMSVLWALYFSKENFDKADKIFQNYTISVDRVNNVIVKAIRQNENVSLAQKFIDALKFFNVRDRVKERAYGAALDVLVLKGMYDEAVALVLESEKLNLELSKYYLSTLVTLKSVLEKENKPVPFQIPLDVSSGSSSDSE